MPEKIYYELPLTLNLTMQGKAKLRRLLYENFRVHEFHDSNELKLVDLEPEPGELEGEEGHNVRRTGVKK